MASLKKTRTIFQLPNVGSWFENIAVRSSGTLLATRVDTAELWEIDPVTGKGSAIVTFPSPHDGTTGITELTPDVFAVGAGQYELGKGTVPGTYEIFLVEFSAGGPGTPKLVTKIPESGLINGLTTWNEHTILAADSEYGVLYKIDVTKGTYSVVSKDEALGSPPGVPMQIGINGVKVREGHVYYTNTMRQTTYKLPVDQDCKPTGPPEAVASGYMQDDFAVDEDGTLFITTNPGNTVVKVGPGTKEGVVVAGNFESLEVAGGTACAFGRGNDDKKVLYVVTAGALAMPVKGDQVEPAKVVAVDLS